MEPLSKESLEVFFHITNDGFGKALHFHNSYEIILIIEGKIWRYLYIHIKDILP